MCPQKRGNLQVIEGTPIISVTVRGIIATIRSRTALLMCTIYLNVLVDCCDTPEGTGGDVGREEAEAGMEEVLPRPTDR